MKKGVITYIRQKKLGSPKRISEPILFQVLSEAMCLHFQVQDFRDAWRQLISPKDLIALKVNCLAGRGLSTHPELVRVIIQQLSDAGIPRKNIVVFDRANRDLTRAGFSIKTQKGDYRCAGNDYWGYHRELVIHRSIGSMISNVMVASDKVINLPVLKDHGITGISAALKNFFGTIHNPNKYHLNVGDPYIADLCSYPLIREKTCLTVIDAITAQYEGGPPFMPAYALQENALIVGQDMVALDLFCWKLIDRWRLQNGLKPLEEVSRKPTYILTAGDPEHNLGEIDQSKIFVNKRGV